ncbi:hypothetical protein RGU41_08970 [Cryobacterium sp. 10C3]|nr:hypothetical protein [Cryobacterium sp. 10C3]MDY7556867.1 hypothetical protein [Cryobacterium sp. 10C3]
MQRVTPEVHQRTTAEGRDVPDRRRVEGVAAGEFAAQGHDVAEPAGRDNGVELEAERVVAVVERLDETLPRLGGRLAHQPGLGGVHREGLFAEHVLAGLERCNRPLGVLRGRQRDIDEVDLRVRKECAVVAV